MEKPDFHSLLNNSTKLCVDFAENYVLDVLSKNVKYKVLFNVSQDNPDLEQFDIYPKDNNRVVQLVSDAEVVELLYRNGKVPVWIDISVESAHNGFTVIQLLCSGRYSAASNEFYYSKSGTGPFGIKSPTFPPNYKDGTKFKLKKTKVGFFQWLNQFRFLFSNLWRA